MALAWVVLIFLLDCPGTSSASSRCTRLTHWIRDRDSSARRSTSNRSASSWGSWARTRRFLVRTATTATACASCGSVLRLCPVSKARALADSLAGTSTTCSPSARSRCANGRPAPLLPSTAHTRSGKGATRLRIAA